MIASREHLKTETPNGALKRCEFIADVIREHRPRYVLDVGCGTGSLLTAPLATLFPDVDFTGVDDDATSISYANGRYRSANLTFAETKDLPEYRRYDMVIASEVIEHVEDPVEFLIQLRKHLRTDGILVLTMPNGYGPYELTAIVESLLHLTGILPALSWLRRRIASAPAARMAPRDTLARSPHINWFSQRRIRSVIGVSGFSIVRYVPRVFLCGLGLQHLLLNERMRRWNAMVADRLPAMLNSGWMFVAAKERSARVQPMRYRRTVYEAFRRLLSERRWSQA